MALDTYANLKTKIADELARSDLTSHIVDFITLADSRINADLRVRQMETTMSTVVAAGVIAVPANYIEMKNAYVSSTSPYIPLQRKSSAWIYQNYPYRSADSDPKFIAREGTNFIFGPYPSGTPTITVVYYNRFVILATAVNAIFTSYPGLWLYASLAESAPHLKNDSRVALWEAKYKAELDRVQGESNKEELSGDVLTMVAG